MAAPMPLVEPVTIAVRPVRRWGWVLVVMDPVLRAAPGWDQGPSSLVTA